MKVLLLNTAFILSCVPRVDISNSDELELVLVNENTKEVLIPTFTFIVSEKLSISISENSVEFKAKEKYKITIKKLGKIIYKGKLLILENGTDIQNYTYDSQSTSKFSFSE